MTISIEPIGIVHSPFEEKFGVPRQPGLVEVISSIELLPPFNLPDAVKGLDGFSHIWVIFQFHQAVREQWKPLVRPPRLGGNEKRGVFATRSPFRPNNIGLSVVELKSIEMTDGKILLKVNGLDVIDNTPILDIKPYIGYADSISDAHSGFAVSAPQKAMQVIFSEQAEQQLLSLGEENLKSLIESALSYDVRPAYRQTEQSAEYGIRLAGRNIRWLVEADRVVVLSVKSTQN